ncbi:MAG: RNA-guided endonuclease TnpB family protein, partial [Candidatus Freyarchaeota archaeon]
QRILSWKAADRVSILTLKGRQVIPVKYGAYQAGRLNRVRGQADLILRNGVFYLATLKSGSA